MVLTAFISIKAAERANHPMFRSLKPFRLNGFGRIRWFDRMRTSDPPLRDTTSCLPVLTPLIHF